jgi:hypothetical protein
MSLELDVHVTHWELVGRNMGWLVRYAGSKCFNHCLRGQVSEDLTFTSPDFRSTLCFVHAPTMIGRYDEVDVGWKSKEADLSVSIFPD